MTGSFNYTPEPQFLGPLIGSSSLVFDAPYNFVQGSAEYLRAGVLKPYSAKYAGAVLAAPQLRVFGSDAKYSASTVTTGTSPVIFGYVGGKYIAAQSGGNGYYGTISEVANKVNSSSLPNGFSYRFKRIPTGGGYAVVSGGANTAPKYTSDNVTWTPVGGDWGPISQVTAICQGGGGWLAISGNVSAYINNVNPSGSWLSNVGAPTASTATNGCAYGNGVFVAVGESSSATAGKLATCPALGSAWVDRTASCGISLKSADYFVDIVFDGTAFTALLSKSSINILVRSVDGQVWSQVGVSDQHTSNGYSSTPLVASGYQELHTDGAGVVVAAITRTTARLGFSVCNNGGSVYKPAQIYSGRVPPSGNSTCGYAGGHWLFCSGDTSSILDLGSNLAVPDYIGQQLQFAAGQTVRIL